MPGATCAAPLDVLIVGAGISGLAAANALSSRFPLLRVLDSRSRVGGRLLSHDGVDLGGSWSWSHDTSAAKLAQKFGIASVSQRLDGNAYVMQQGGAAQRVGDVGDQIAPCGPMARRFAGGYAELPRQLAASLPEDALRLDTRVVSLEHQPAAGASSLPSTIKVGIEGGEPLFARRVILALPPRLASRIEFTPALPEATQRRLASTATWCGDWAKVVAIFREPFWRARGDSGTAATPGGLVDVWWEANSAGPDSDDVGLPALGGLTFGAAGAARLDAFGPASAVEPLSAASASKRAAGDPAGASESPSGLRAEVVRTLGALYGEDVVAEQLVRVTHKAWMADADTYASPPGGREPPGDPRSSYGHPQLRTPLAWGVHFAGTESESESGHVSGALMAAERAAREVASALEHE